MRHVLQFNPISYLNVQHNGNCTTLTRAADFAFYCLFLILFLSEPSCSWSPLTTLGATQAS